MTDHDQRITECPPLGVIFHRPQTTLLPPRRCYAGHLAPRYLPRGDCVVCARIRLAERRARTQGRPHRPWPGKLFTDYQAAREHHEDKGGWLLVRGPGAYLVTDDYSQASRARGVAWLARCDELECWDEVELARMTRQRVAA